jgi:hypothetical protein
MKSKKLTSVTAIVIFALLAIPVRLAAQEPRRELKKEDRGRPVTYVIDPSIYNGPPSLPDAGRGLRALAAVEDEKGIVSRFISNEVIFSGSQADLTAFLAKHEGNVIATIAPLNSPAALKQDQA